MMFVRRRCDAGMNSIVVWFVVPESRARFQGRGSVVTCGWFRLVILDLGDVPGKEARRIISSWWYRFRRTVEDGPRADGDFRRGVYAIVRRVSLELNGAAEWSRVSEDGTSAPQRDQRKSPASAYSVANESQFRRQPLIRLDFRKFSLMFIVYVCLYSRLEATGRPLLTDFAYGFSPVVEEVRAGLCDRRRWL
jgi:hypothetical protein